MELQARSLVWPGYRHETETVASPRREHAPYRYLVPARRGGFSDSYSPSGSCGNLVATSYFPSQTAEIGFDLVAAICDRKEGIWRSDFFMYNLPGGIPPLTY